MCRCACMASQLAAEYASVGEQRRHVAHHAGDGLLASSSLGAGCGSRAGRGAGRSPVGERIEPPIIFTVRYTSTWRASSVGDGQEGAHHRCEQAGRSHHRDRSDSGRRGAVPPPRPACRPSSRCRRCPRDAARRRRSRADDDSVVRSRCPNVGLAADSRDAEPRDDRLASPGRRSCFPALGAFSMVRSLLAGIPGSRSLAHVRRAARPRFAARRDTRLAVASLMAGDVISSVECASMDGEHRSRGRRARPANAAAAHAGEPAVLDGWREG